ncbi:hypothetical protein EU95_1974 [Prochlorococcus marinus str. MIT 9201]|uniref:Uncharacterized protein n=1 Tax=Prochlorococcus marinus str. MIT 9201 TaxID=93057 RepID=A0A0A1ZZF7_PROMR|nr:hypothetical protein EU95_1974 [Prochlorococcus marinus str. MIT 9201]
MISMTVKRQNWEGPLNGSKLTNFPKNLIFLFYLRNIFK